MTKRKGLSVAGPDRWGEAPRYLKSGVRSTHEVLTYLRRRGISAGRAASLVAAYRAQGLLDDRAAARLWADHWARQGYASAVVRLKLEAKGFSSDVSDATITQFVPSTDDEARARLVAAQRAHRATGRLARTHLARGLASRGFDSDLIERILHESFGSE